MTCCIYCLFIFLTCNICRLYCHFTYTRYWLCNKEVFPTTVQCSQLKQKSINPPKLRRRSGGPTPSTVCHFWSRIWFFIAPQQTSSEMDYILKWDCCFVLFSSSLFFFSIMWDEDISFGREGGTVRFRSWVNVLKNTFIMFTQLTIYIFMITCLNMYLRIYKTVLIISWMHLCGCPSHLPEPRSFQLLIG